MVGACYGFAESTRVKIDRQTIALPRLPEGFRGTTVAFLTDVHLGPFVTADYVASVVRTTMMLNPDLVLLGGDYSHRDGKYIAPCFEVLAGCRPRSGCTAYSATTTTGTGWKRRRPG